MGKEENLCTKRQD